MRTQSLRDYEHLIVDNASTDGTVQVAGALGDPRIRITSEPDRGIFDAMSKGVAAARGGLIAILNAGDVYTDADVLADVAARFGETGADVVYGDLDFVDREGRVRRRWRSRPYDEARWGAGWHPPHPATFVTRAAYDKAGLYDASYRLAAEYKLMLALGLKHRAHFAHLPRTLVRMALGGASTSGPGAIVRSNLEVLRAWKELGLPAPLLLIPRKLLFKLMGKL